MIPFSELKFQKENTMPKMTYQILPKYFLILLNNFKVSLMENQTENREKIHRHTAHYIHVYINVHVYIVYVYIGNFLMIHLILPKTKYISFHWTWLITQCTSVMESVWQDEGRLLPGAELCSFSVHPCSAFLVHSAFLRISPRVVFMRWAVCQWHSLLATRSGGNPGGFKENDVLLVSKAPRKQFRFL